MTVDWKEWGQIFVIKCDTEKDVSRVRKALNKVRSEELKEQYPLEKKLMLKDE